MKTCLLRVLLTGWTVFLGSLLLAAPAPVPSIEEDVTRLASIASEKTTVCDGKPIKTEKRLPGANEIVPPFTPMLQFIKGNVGLEPEFKGKKEFLEKPGITGLLCVSLTGSKGGTLLSMSYYRFEERDKQRLLVIPDLEGGEIAFTYEIDGKILKIKGGKPGGIGALDSATLAGEYTIRNAPPPKK